MEYLHSSYVLRKRRRRDRLGTHSIELNVHGGDDVSGLGLIEVEDGSGRLYIDWSRCIDYISNPIHVIRVSYISSRHVNV